MPRESVVFHTRRRRNSRSQNVKLALHFSIYKRSSKCQVNFTFLWDNSCSAEFVIAFITCTYVNSALNIGNESSSTQVDASEVEAPIGVSQIDVAPIEASNNASLIDAAQNEASNDTSLVDAAQNEAPTDVAPSRLRPMSHIDTLIYKTLYYY